MAFRFRSIIVPSLMALCALAPQAEAGIGRVGGTGPVEVMNQPHEPRYHPPAEPSGGPLLTIRFNRHFVYFQQALKEAVTSTQNVKPGAAYRVVTSIPPGDSPAQTQRFAQQAHANMQSVVDQLMADGVAESQIHVETTTGQPGEPQEMQIFVQ